MLEERFSSQLKARDENGNYVVDDARLVNYLQNPGTVPSFMVLSEIERRQAENMRREKAQAQPQAPTVKDQAIASLGQQMPQGMPMPEQVAMNPAERASSGIAALNPPVQMAEGGVVGYAAGDLVKQNLFAGPDFTRQNVRNYPGMPPYYPESERTSLSDQFTFPGMDRTQMQVFKEKARLENKIKNRENVTYDDIQQLNELNSIIEKGGRGGYEPGDVVDKTPTTLPTLQEDLPIGETTAGKPGLKDQPASIFEGARLDTGKRDTSKFDELMMEDPDVYRARMEREREETLGESPFGKALDTETERAKKAQSRKKDFVVGEFLMNLGNSVMQQKPGEALDLTKATDRLAQGNQEYLDMIRNDDKYKLELQRLDRADREATLKFGIDSEERARINNQKVGLESIKTQVEYDKMANELEKANISATAYGRYLAATLGRDKLGFDAFTKAQDRLMKDPTYKLKYTRKAALEGAEKLDAKQQAELDKIKAELIAAEMDLIDRYKKAAGFNNVEGMDTGTVKPGPIDYSTLR